MSLRVLLPSRLHLNNRLQDRVNRRLTNLIRLSRSSRVRPDKRRSRANQDSSRPRVDNSSDQAKTDLRDRMRRLRLDSPGSRVVRTLGSLVVGFRAHLGNRRSSREGSFRDLVDLADQGI